MIAPASTGKVSNSNTAVTMTAQVNKGIRSNVNLGARILITVTMKLMAPRVELTPAKCSAKMAKSTDALE